MRTTKMNDFIRRENAIRSLSKAIVSKFIKDAVLSHIYNLPSADVVSCEELLKTADEQEKQGFIQTAMILRELVK